MPETHAAAHPQLGFWRKYVFSTDHKIIGIQYMITAMAMAVVGGTLSMLMRYSSHGRRCYRRRWQRSCRMRLRAAS